jgi:aldose 1-epimerase
MAVKKQIFGKTADGIRVDLFTLANAQGMTVEITNYGAAVVSLEVPDPVIF